MWWSLVVNEQLRYFCWIHRTFGGSKPVGALHNIGWDFICGVFCRTGVKAHDASNHKMVDAALHSVSNIGPEEQTTIVLNIILVRDGHVAHEHGRGSVPPIDEIVNGLRYSCSGGRLQVGQIVPCDRRFIKSSGKTQHHQNLRAVVCTLLDKEL